MRAIRAMDLEMHRYHTDKAERTRRAQEEQKKRRKGQGKDGSG